MTEGMIFGVWPEWDRGLRRVKDVPVFDAEVVKVPEGPAPEEVRAAWLGVEIPVVKDLEDQLEVNPLTRETQPKRASYASPKDLALWALVENGHIDAALWFRRNFQNFTLLSFGADELRIIGVSQVYRASIDMKSGQVTTYQLTK